MPVFDLIWFSIARITAINEQEKSMPLPSLIEASKMSEGVSKIWDLSARRGKETLPVRVSAFRIGTKDAL